MKKIGNGLFIILFFKLSLLIYFLFTLHHCSAVVHTVIKRVGHLNIKSKKGKLIVLILMLGECIATDHWLQTPVEKNSYKEQF